jgi:phosphoribosyl-ATP pyrophosphohydrolase/phosphoribosyl-AMP cyclohydrolase
LSNLIDKINWDKTPLIPAVVQEIDTNEILMLAYMNKEALDLTLLTSKAHYFSRSKNRIWMKGESSGNIQNVKDILIDCDEDSLVLKVEQIGGSACHTGQKSCFYRDLKSNQSISDPLLNSDDMYSVIDLLYHTIESKKQTDITSSYTALLFDKGENTIVKKIVEEAGELSFAIKDGDIDEIIYECADLVYHVLVGLSYSDVNPDRVKTELKRRFGTSGIEEKNSRTK